MSLKHWAIYRLSDGYIDNTILYDDDEHEWTPPEEHGMMVIPDGTIQGEHSACGIGWSYINGQFIEPALPAGYEYNTDNENVVQQPIAEGVTNL